MKLPFTPLRLLQLDALSARRTVRREPVMEGQARHLHDDDPDELPTQPMPVQRFGRIAAEVALEEGGQCWYAPRSEAELLEARRG